MVITGGPGTGKTTIVKYLLQDLQNKPEFANHKVYLAAPSGKAADRLRESIAENGKLPDNYEALTIHRLLAYNPASNEFTYNENNPFDENSIFVIDEASMIDLELFAKLLQAIPDNNRVYLLGDKDQLPSVEAGAVLGDILASAPQGKIAALKNSHRFKEDSAVGRLALSMQENDKEKITKEIQAWKTATELANAIKNLPQDTNLQLFNYPASEGKRITRAEKQKWLEEVLKALRNQYCKVGEKSEDNFEYFTEDVLLKRSQEARILCAEHDGVFGIDNINDTLNKLLHHSKKTIISKESTL